MDSITNISIGLVELPLPELTDRSGRQWATPRRDTPMVSKQILMADLMAAGYETHLINLKWGTDRRAYGEVRWNDLELTKYMTGGNPFALDPLSFDLWGITVNLCIQREIAFLVIRHLAVGGRPVVVGGSDAIAETRAYLQAGAAAVVLDKSGGANSAVLQAVLGRRDKAMVAGAVFADHPAPFRRARALPIGDWALPTIDVARSCFGGLAFRRLFPRRLSPMGAIIPDYGCDRSCDFCQTPDYRLGYKSMRPDKALTWIARQKEAGARSVNLYSDQFLARVLHDHGREDVMEIMAGTRSMGMATLFSNGLELAKMTRGHGRGADPMDLWPDEALTESLCAWDGEKGLSYLYVAGERPLFGRSDYKKLLPWPDHVTLMKEIVRTGVPYIAYGVIIGFADDTHDSLGRLEEALLDFRDQLLLLNPQLHFSIEPYALILIPGTRQDRAIREAGLLQFDDPTLMGGFWTPCMNTHALSYREISGWQHRLAKLSTAGPRAEFGFIETGP